MVAVVYDHAALSILFVAFSIASIEWALTTKALAPRKALDQLFGRHSKDDRELRRNVHQAVVRIIGCLHLIIQLPLALAVLRDPAMQSDRLYSTSPRSQLMLCISAGYFLHDLFLCVTRFSEWGPAYLIHALLCFTLYVYGALTNCLHFYGAMFLLWESSTPCVYVRWCLHKLGKADSRMYIVNGIAMVATFVLCRNIFGIAMSIDFMRTTAMELASPRPGGISVPIIWLYRVANVILNTLNAVWAYKMVSGAAKLLRRQQHKTKDA